MEESEEEEQWLRVLEEQQLQKQTIKQGQNINGYIFFEGVLLMKNIELVVPLIDTQHGS